MIGGATVLGVITARGGSKGVPGKNALVVGGRPLLEWTIRAARGSRHIDRLILSSDDPQLIQLAERAGCEAPFQRAAALASDAASSVDVLIDALGRVPGYDIVVLLQPTSPLRTAADIDATLELLDASGAPSCVSVRAAADHPYLTFRIDESRQLQPFVAAAPGTSLRRQDLPPAWCLNGAVYAARVPWFVREKTFLAPQTRGYCMPDERSLDIDTHADVARFRALVESVTGADRAEHA